MQLLRLLSSLLLASTATAQLLTNGDGSLPACGQSCAILTQAQSECNGASSTSLQAWSCFCQKVWTASGGSLSTVCASSCSSPTDDSAISTWYTNNCGSDNGASEHGGNTGGTGSDNPASSAAASTLPSTTAASGSAVTGANDQGCATWWSCHWKWVVMIIVVAVGLLILGFGGRWLKKRHDRKQDRISATFNSGITTRGVPVAAGNANDSHVSAMAERHPSGDRNSPSRTRDVFMPYGYGYTRSESRLGSHNNQDRSSPLARGGTPLNDLEKSEISSAPIDPSSKSRRVKVRERLMGGDGLEKR